MSLLTAFLAATIRTATPLLFMALGEMLVEQGGVINLGLEGIVIVGAFGAVLGSAFGVAGGFVVGALAGVALAALFGVFVLILGAEQIITGTAVTMLGLGLTGTLYRWIYGATGVALSIPTLPTRAIPGLTHVAVLGPALFDQPVVTYVGYLLVPALSWWVYRTHAGLGLRAIGYQREAARAAGLATRRTQMTAILAGGVLGGVGGAMLVLAQVGTFTEGMSAGRGYIAVAVVALGAARPVGTALAALGFGAASALQFLAQAMGWKAPYQLFLAIPYVAALIALVVVGRRGSEQSSSRAVEQSNG